MSQGRLRCLKHEGESRRFASRNGKVGTGTRKVVRAKAKKKKKATTRSR
jgi:hypothetical protein